MGANQEKDRTASSPRSGQRSSALPPSAQTWQQQKCSVTWTEVSFLDKQHMHQNSHHTVFLAQQQPEQKGIKIWPALKTLLRWASCPGCMRGNQQPCCVWRTKRGCGRGWGNGNTVLQEYLKELQLLE